MVISSKLFPRIRWRCQTLIRPRACACMCPQVQGTRWSRRWRCWSSTESSPGTSSSSASSPHLTVTQHQRQAAANLLVYPAALTASAQPLPVSPLPVLPPPPRSDMITALWFWLGSSFFPITWLRAANDFFAGHKFGQKFPSRISMQQCHSCLPLPSSYETHSAMFTWRISEISWLHKLSLIVTPETGSNYLEEKN